MNEMTEEIFQKELKIFDKHYKDSRNSSCNVFLSIFEDQKSKEIMIEQFTLIASNNNNKTNYITTIKQLEHHILSLISDFHNDMHMFSEVTFIIDLDQNNEKEKILKNLIPLFDFIIKESTCNFHILTNYEQIQNDLLNTIIYESRTKLTYFNKGFVSTLFLKNQLEKELKENSILVNKIKI